MKRLKVVKSKWGIISEILYPVIAFVILLILWQTQALNSMFSIDTQIFPQPFHIIGVLNDNIGKMMDDIWSTISAIFIGLFIGSILGYLLAIFAALFPVAGKGGISLVTAFNAIPIIALTPVFMNLTKIGGGSSDFRSMMAKIMVVTVVSMSSMSITAYRGLTELKPFSDDLLLSYACNKKTILFKLRMPNSIPYVFTALKIGIPTAVITSVVSEYFTESTVGVGYQIKANINLMQFSTAWSYIFVACIMGIVLYMLLMLVSGITLRNRKS